jgi:hypothetical protein
MMRFLLLLGFIGLCFCPPICAELNGNVSSVESDSERVGGLLSSRSSYYSTIYEIRDPNGTVIREFVSPKGRIFAVAWEGRFVPEMTHLLGGLFQEYSRAVHSEHPNHSWRQPLFIHTPTLAFESGGHMGWYYGRAYVQAEIPNGFPMEEIH